MTLLATIYQTSLSDPPATSAIGSATSWVSDLLFGPLATIIAVIAIAWVGFAMLSGRVDIRRGLSVVLGCFFLFGAQGIVELEEQVKAIASGRANLGSQSVHPTVGASPPPSFSKASKIDGTANAFDPYAGAAVVQSGE